MRPCNERVEEIKMAETMLVIVNSSEHRLPKYALRAAAAPPSHEVLKMQELHGNTLQASMGAGVV